MSFISATKDRPKKSKSGEFRSIFDETMHLITQGVSLKVIPENERRRQVSSNIRTDRDRLMAQIKRKHDLLPVSSRPLRVPSMSHVARIAPPCTYVTPRDALFKDIIHQRFSLKSTHPNEMVSPQGELDLTVNLSEQSLCANCPSMMASRMEVKATKRDFEKSGKRKLKLLAVPDINFLASWNPVQQVQLGFATNSDARESVATQACTNIPNEKKDSEQRKVEQSLALPPLKAQQRPSEGTTCCITSIENIPSPRRGIEINEWAHIRENLVRAQFENLSLDNPTLHMAVEQGKCCGSCHGKFRFFKPGRQCVVCKLVVCFRCSPNIDVPAQVKRQLETLKANPDTANTVTVCKHCKHCLTEELSESNIF